MTIINTTSSTPLPANNASAGKPNSGTISLDTPVQSANTISVNTPATPAPASSTVISLSTISTQLQAAQSSTSSDSDFSLSKVNAIKKAILEGSFQVNPSKVADGLLDSVHNLLNARKQSH